MVASHNQGSVENAMKAMQYHGLRRNNTGMIKQDLITLSSCEAHNCLSIEREWPPCLQVCAVLVYCWEECLHLHTEV